jgi:pimeloyl-ACP methyl ester carboxylesterase
MNLNKKLHYQIIGSDSPSKMVFLHGILGRGRNWQAIAKALASGRQCLLVDQRGHGQSFHPPTGYLVEDYAQDLADLVRHLGWTQPLDLVGHSMGGRVALVYTHLHPELVNRLAIVDIGPTSDWTSMQAILEKIDFVPTPFHDRAEARHFMETEFLAQFSNPMVMEFFYSNLHETSHGYDWVFYEPGVRQSLESARHRDYWEEFKSLQCPTLLLRGELSADLPQADFERVLQQNPRVDGVVVPGAGHWVHAEKPRETLELLANFFKLPSSQGDDTQAF